MKIPVPTEHQEQVALCRWLRLNKIGFFAIPNAARRSAMQGAWMKQEGLVAGAPDLVLVPVAPSGGTRHVAIELKRSKGSRIADTQKAMHELMLRHSWIVLVAYGWAHAVEQLKELGYGI